MENSHKYDDIIHLSRPVSSRKVKMPMVNRGAQFSPFAALVGYEAVIAEEGRLTDFGTELDEGGKELLDRKLREILENPRQADFLCFVPDERKEGGSYSHILGTIKRVESHRGVLLLTDGREIPVESIRNIE